MIVPSAHRSTSQPWPRPESISGAMCCGVPHSVNVRPPSGSFFASRKSSTWPKPSAVSAIVSGESERSTMPSNCRLSSANRTHEA